MPWPYLDYSIVKYGFAGVLFTLVFFYVLYKACTYVMGEDD